MPRALLLCLGLATAVVALAAGLAAAEELRGTVVAVIDGDTLSLRSESGVERVRLAGIDTPEARQPFGPEARATLFELAFGESVRVVVSDRDRYGRLVGEVFRSDGMHLNAELVRRGMAWVYRRYATSDALYALEQDAREASRGLWALPDEDRIAPWDWRRGGRRGPDPAPADFACEGPRTCSQLRSCAEARFQLERCKLTKLDGDGDGIPCESLCR